MLHNAAGVFGYGCGLFGGSVGVLLQKGKDGGTVKIVPQLPGCDRLGSVRGKVGQPPPAFLNGYTFPEKQGGKLVKAASPVKGFPYGLPEPLLVRFKLRLPGRDTVHYHRGIGFIKGKLSFLLRPVFTLGHSVLAAMQKVNLIQIFPVAHLHDFGLEIFHSCVCAAVLHAGFCVCWSVHIGQKRDSFNPQTVYDDMHMNVAGVVVSVRVGADNGLVSGKMLSAKFLAQRLRLINGQTVVRSVPWVKADDIVVRLHIFPFLVLAIVEIGAHTGNGKIFLAAVQRGKTVVLTGDKLPVFIKGGLHGKLVMLKSKVLLGCSVVGIFRADMFECCQQLHPLSARLQTSRRQGRKWRLGFRRTGRCMVRRIRSDTGQSD